MKCSKADLTKIYKDEVSNGGSWETVSSLSGLTVNTARQTIGKLRQECEDRLFVMLTRGGTSQEKAETDAKEMAKKAYPFFAREYGTRKSAGEDMDAAMAAALEGVLPVEQLAETVSWIPKNGWQNPGGGLYSRLLSLLWGIQVEMLYYGSKPMTPFMKIYLAILFGMFVAEYVKYLRMKRKWTEHDKILYYLRP